VGIKFPKAIITIEGAEPFHPLKLDHIRRHLISNQLWLQNKTKVDPTIVKIERYPNKVLDVL
jgi:hypothetical protein